MLKPDQWSLLSAYEDRDSAFSDPMIVCSKSGYNDGDAFVEGDVLDHFDHVGVD